MDNIEHVIIYCDSNKFIASLKQVLIYFLCYEIEKIFPVKLTSTENFLGIIWYLINLFNDTFLYPLKTSENLCWGLFLIKVQIFRTKTPTQSFCCFPGVKKRNISLKWVKLIHRITSFHLALFLEWRIFK